MRKVVMLLTILSLSLFTFGCRKKENTYITITPQEAKTIMDNEINYIILDVRSLDEYNNGHIQNAIVIPHDEIAEKAQEILKNKEQLILVYCRSGRRSKIAAENLVKLGYTNIKEFGGINDWPYEIVK